MVDTHLERGFGRPEDAGRFQSTRGAVWLRNNFAVETSDFGAKVAHLLDRLAGGLWHYDPQSALRRAEWTSNWYVETSWYRDIATYDHGHLTRFVLLCHELHIRGTVRPSNPNHLRLGFSRRVRNGGVMDGHPTIERVLTGFRAESEGMEGPRG